MRRQSWNRRDVLGLFGGALAADAIAPLLAGAAQNNAPGSGTALPRGAIVRTVLRDVPAISLTGQTLFHEHVSLQDHTAYDPPRPAPAQLHYTEDAALVTDEIKAAGRDGLACIVDAGHTDMGRSMATLRRVATDSGVHVVASGGYYLDRAYPANVASDDEDQLADALVREAAANRYGALGEIGTSAEMTVKERKVFRVIGKAQARTGLGIYTHNAVYMPDAADAAMKAAMLQLDVLESAGADLRRVVVGHLCCHDDPKIVVPLAVAKRGAFIGFDRVVSGEMILPDASRLRMALALIDAGHADKLLLSSDFSFDRHLKRSGGPGYAMTLTVFVPKLRQAGVSEVMIRQITIENPRRLLAFVPK